MEKAKRLLTAALMVIILASLTGCIVYERRGGYGYNRPYGSGYYYRDRDRDRDWDRR
ncbi:MAG TPA: hypothetical protein VGL11_05955 [Candidatus Binatia bacterium]|jgi:hypothetical protein